MIRAFAAHPTASNLLVLAIVLLGLAVVGNLQRDTFPVVDATEVEVRIAWPGATPADAEHALCLPLEQVLAGIENRRELRCDARPNLAVATLELNEGADVDAAHDDVKAAVEAIDRFPERAKPPVVRTLKRTATVAAVAITGPLDDWDLHRYAQTLARTLAADPRLGPVTVAGLSTREIEIALDPAALRRHDLTVEEVRSAIGRASLDLAAGDLESALGRSILRFAGERRDLDAFRALPIRNPPLGTGLTLGEIAEVRRTFTEPHRRATFDGERAVLVEVAKTERQDGLRVRAALEEHLERARAAAPPGLALTVSQDSTRNIEERLRLLLVNGAQGLVLVLAVTWLAFGLRMGLWIALGLPVSFLGAVFAMFALGLTINMITLVALVVAIGLLVDDSIVIAENVATRRAAGLAPLEAAIEGTRQVAPGVLASFLTTALVVAPLALMEGQMGAVLRLLPVVLVITLAVSLVEAFFVLPHHLAGALRAGQRAPHLADRLLGRAAGLAGRSVRVLVPFRYLVSGLAAALVILAFLPLAAGWLKFQPWPTLESDVLQARLVLPQGTPVARTEAVVERLLQGLRAVDAEFSPQEEDGLRLVRHVTVHYGVNVDAPETGPHLATISADLLPAQERRAQIGELIRAWRQAAGRPPDVQALKITDRERGVAGNALEIRLAGPDSADLALAAAELDAFIRRFPGLRDLAADLRPGAPEWQATLRADAAGALGIDAQAAAQQLRAAFLGDTDLEIRDAAGTIEVAVRLAAADRASADDVLDLPMRASGGGAVPLSAVVEIEAVRGWARIHRIDGERTVTLVGAIDPRVANAREILAAVRAELLPAWRERLPGVAVTFVGEARETEATGRSLQLGAALGLAGVYALLAFVFRSYLLPLTVLVAIPAGFVGVVVGHLLMGLNLSIPSLVGFATLAGVVVNNAILLMGVIAAERAAGATPDMAVAEAVRQRFRAVALTAVTTVVGLLPLLLETSTQAQLMVPLVTSLAFGLVVATFLTLIVTPLMAAILADLRPAEAAMRS